VTDLTIGGRPAVKASYRIPSPKVDAEAVQFRVLMPDGLVCGITVGTMRGKMLPEDRSDRHHVPSSSGLSPNVGRVIDL
jgi:hypothetical protein